MSIEEAMRIIEGQREQIVLLLKRVEELEARLKANSSNSSKPPSSDGFCKPSPEKRSLRKKSGRKPGGQSGHPGGTLGRKATPDIVERHLPEVCEHCGAVHGVDAEMKVLETRQVLDLPEPLPSKSRTTIPSLALRSCFSDPVPLAAGKPSSIWQAQTRRT